MKSHLESVDLMVTTRKNSLPTSKPVAGRFRLSPELDTASFVEEDATVIYGEPKSRRMFARQNCSVWYDPEKDIYKIRVTMKPSRSAVLMAECDFQECINYIIRKIYGTE